MDDGFDIWANREVFFMYKHWRQFLYENDENSDLERDKSFLDSNEDSLVVFCEVNTVWWKNVTEEWLNNNSNMDWSSCGHGCCWWWWCGVVFFILGANKSKTIYQIVEVCWLTIFMPPLSCLSIFDGTVVPDYATLAWWLTSQFQDNLLDESRLYIGGSAMIS